MASVSPSVKRKEAWTSRSFSSSSPNWNLGEAGGGGSHQSKASCPFDGWRPQRTGTCSRRHSKSMVTTGLDQGGVGSVHSGFPISPLRRQGRLLHGRGRGPLRMAMAGQGPHF